MYYRTEDGWFILIHTEVPYRFTGQGIGSQLARGVFEAIRAQGGEGRPAPPVHGRLLCTPSRTFRKRDRPERSGPPVS
ncbi:GNAT family N-acetyltransferase [Oryzicola mucosus]|uniref:GNAT family N-acetyltransferase n=1 Tax=Oryzicola mucosus TaxID=2767425 RepID=UPI0038B32264